MEALQREPWRNEGLDPNILKLRPGVPDRTL
jgi:hypothetical protein